MEQETQQPQEEQQQEAMSTSMLCSLTLWLEDPGPRGALSLEGTS